MVAVVVVVVAFVDVVKNDENKGEKKYYKIEEYAAEVRRTSNTHKYCVGSPSLFFFISLIPCKRAHFLALTQFRRYVNHSLRERI